MSFNFNFQLQKSTIIALLLLVVICGILWGYSFYKECNNDKQGKNSAKESFSGNECSDPAEDLLKPFNPKIKGYNDDLHYENQSEKPWQHHDVQGSLPVDPVVKYSKAYYYEFDNKKYMDKLKIALAVPCALLADAVNDSSWSAPYQLDMDNIDDTNVDVSKEVKEAYDACIENVATKLNSSSAMILPGYIDKASSKPETENSAISADIQIVHDVMRSYRMHLKEKSMYLIDIELLLYRENKFEGKHVKLSCTAKFLPNRKVWFTNVVAVDILGVVPEDHIALFPVNASNPFDIPAQEETEN